MTTYTSNNVQLLLDGKTVGSVKNFTMLHSPPDIAISRDPLTGRVKHIPIPSRHIESIELTYEAVINPINISDFINGKVMGVTEWESDGEQFLLVKGHIRDYRIEGTTLILNLEREKTYEEQETERILTELRRRGYMQHE